MFNVLIGQSGGPTCAINASLAGVLEVCLNSKKVDNIYGAVNGIEGVLKENFLNLTDIFKDDTSKKLSELSVTPSSALGSCRIKMPPIDSIDSMGFYSNLFSIFEKLSIKAFFYIGGNDSMDTVMKLSEISNRFPYKIQFIGVPKTIDNDLVLTDHTPGYGCASKYIASTVQDIVMDCSVYTVKSVTLVEIMGRDSGWLTAAAAIPSIEGNGPDYVYLPEVPFDVEDFLNDVNKAHEKHPNVVICLSEGIRDKEGRYVGESSMSGSVDVFGHKYLSGSARYLEHVIKKRIGCKVRAFDLNLPQRCASYLLSETDISESFKSGKFAAESMLNGKSGFMVSVARNTNPYSVDFSTVDVKDVANKVKTIPLNYINEKGNYVTNECIDYILPLIKGEVKLNYVNGIPHHLKLK